MFNLESMDRDFSARYLDTQSFFLGLNSRRYVEPPEVISHQQIISICQGEV